MSKRKKIAIAVLSAFMGLFLFLSALGGALLLAEAVCDANGRAIPSYEKLDLSPYLEKEEWTEEDFAVLSMQTGLSAAGIRSVPRESLAEFQTALFSPRKTMHEAVSYFSSYDFLVEPDASDTRVRAPLVPLEKGDVLVSTSSHTVGWRHGHSALVTDPALGQILQCISVGMSSKVYNNGIRWFYEASNFMVLRLKGVSAEERARIADRAADELQGIPYSLTVGILSKKDQCRDGAPQVTHCSHLVWQAFWNEGYDIDSNGGGLCQTTDIIASPLFEIVQIYGFDPAEYFR